MWVWPACPPCIPLPRARACTGERSDAAWQGPTPTPTLPSPSLPTSQPTASTTGLPDPPPPPPPLPPMPRGRARWRAGERTQPDNLYPSQRLSSSTTIKQNTHHQIVGGGGEDWRRGGGGVEVEPLPGSRPAGRSARATQVAELGE